MKLEGKVAVVTGGSRGIGRAIVLEAVRQGARAFFCAREIGAAASDVVREAESLGGAGCVTAQAADVSREADVEALIDAVMARYGRVDILVNNAGINRDALLVHHSTESFDEVMAVNLTGPFLTCRRVVKEFLARGEGGRIVSIGSFSQNGASSQAAYGASKAGLGGLTRTIAKEYGHARIFANVVAAGYVETELTERVTVEARDIYLSSAPLRRTGTAEEIARVVTFLASDEATFINGETLHATGGLWEVYR